MRKLTGDERIDAWALILCMLGIGLILIWAAVVPIC